MKNKILFVTASTQNGGAERMLFNIISSLYENHECKLLITSNDQIPKEYKNIIPSINLNKKHAINSFFQLLKVIKEFKPKYIFTTSSNIGYLVIIAKKLLREKFKIYIRCAVTPCEIYHNDLKTRILSYINKITYNSADLVISQTDFMRNDLIKSYKIDPHKVKTIRNIVNKSFILEQSLKYQPSELIPDNYNILAVGALYSVKGFDLLIDAVAPLIKNTKRHLYIIGEERYEKGYKLFLKNKIYEYNLENNIHLLGHKNNPYPYFKAADLFVMSSRKEGYPNVVLEALTLGKFVIVTDVVDWSDTVYHGKNGLICKKNDIESLKASFENAFSLKNLSLNTELSNFDYNEIFK